MFQKLQEIQQEINLIKNNNPFFYKQIVAHHSFEIQLSSLIEHAQINTPELTQQAEKLISLWETVKNDSSPTLQLDIKLDEIQNEINGEKWGENRDQLVLEISNKISKQFQPILEENTKQLKSANKHFKQVKTLFNQHKEELDALKLEEFETDFSTATSSYLRSKNSLEKLKATVNNLSRPDKLLVHFYTIGRLDYLQNPQEFLTQEEETGLDKAFQPDHELLQERINTNTARIHQQIERGDISQAQGEETLTKIVESLNLSTKNKSRNSHYAGRKYAKQQIEEFYTTISPMIQLAITGFQEDLAHFISLLNILEEDIQLTVSTEQ